MKIRSDTTDQLHAFSKKVDEAWNNNDAAALAALFTEDAVIVTDHGPVHGLEAIGKHWADVFSEMAFQQQTHHIRLGSP